MKHQQVKYQKPKEESKSISAVNDFDNDDLWLAEMLQDTSLRKAYIDKSKLAGDSSIEIKQFLDYMDLPFKRI